MQELYGTPPLRFSVDLLMLARMTLAEQRRAHFLEWMRQNELNANQIAKASGVSYTTLRSYLEEGPKGTKSLKGDNEAMIAAGYETTVEEIFGGKVPSFVPIIGRVGADPEGTVIRTLGQAANDFAPLPKGATSKAVALEVDGHSMGTVIEDGSLIFFENQEMPPSEDLIGEKVVVQIAGGEDEADDTDVLVKILRRGSKPGLYDLESINGPTLRDVKIRWAAEIIQITPPRQARRLIRRGVA